MLHGRWTIENRAALEKLLAQKFDSMPIAIFDWDYTCIAGDTANMVFHEQCRDLAFQFTHPDFQTWVEEIPIPTRILECVEMFLARDTRATRAALRFELERTRWALHESEDDNQAWAWDTGAFVGWAPQQVREYTRRVIARELAQPLRAEFLTRPAYMRAENIGARVIKQDLSGDESSRQLRAFYSGRDNSSALHYLERAQQMRAMDLDADMTLPIPRGLRVRTEMRELMYEFRSAGWNVFIITASPQWEIEAFAERYFIPPQNVIGMRRVIVNGRITAAIAPPCSWGDGKLDAYNLFVTRERPPNFVAGDSIGDWKLLEWATACALVVEPTTDSLRAFTQWQQSRGENWLIQKFKDEG